MFKYFDTNQFRDAIRNVTWKAQLKGLDEDGNPILDRSAIKPKILYRGTVKLHGTNSSIIFDVSSETVTFQSRERTLSLTSDNGGFMLGMSRPDRQAHILKIFQTLKSQYLQAKHIGIYGEWFGNGIQRGVAVTEVPKSFGIFAIKIITESEEVPNFWLDIEPLQSLISEPDLNIYSIQDFGVYDIEIDFEKPEYAQNQIIKLTEEVEADCPAGQYFKTENRTGEGIVWRPHPSEVTWQSSKYAFKSKGEKHSVSKVKTLAPIDIEAIESIREFVEYAVTENRMEQMLQKIQRELNLPFEMSSLGEFIRNVYNDVLKEELDTITENQIEIKKLGSAIANKCRPWYIQKFNQSEPFHA